MRTRKLICLIFCVVYLCTVILSSVGCSISDNSTTNKLESSSEGTIKGNENNGEERDSKEGDQNEQTDEANQNDSDAVDKVVFSAERPRTSIDVPYEKLVYDTLVNPYQIQEDLSNIENLEQFGEFTYEQKNILSKNGFVVSPTNEEQLFYIYENNEYLKVPSFVSTDSVLQVYHIFFDYSLRTLENEKLLGFVETLSENMLDKSVYLYNKTKNKDVKQALLKNTAFFSTAWLCLEKNIPDNVPSEAVSMAEEEYELIKSEVPFGESTIFPFQLDYSQFKPRGHYTRSKDLERYFKAMMWYGQAPFPFYMLDENREEVRDVEQTLQALLITYCVFLEKNNSNDVELWENIFEPTDFYVGNSDDLTIYHYKDILIEVYGNEPNIEELNIKENLDKVYLLAEDLPEPQIQAKYTTVTTPVGKQLRFMGQRYVPDAHIIQELVKPIERPIPSGLDVMGVLGSDRAYDIQINVNHEDEKWSGYPAAFDKMKDKFDKLDEEEWKSNMYYGWMWTLKGLLNKFGEGYPSFMTNEAWEDKSLSNALASWSELKHDTILYGKQSGAECGGGEEPPKIRGYVEPNIEVYEKLLWLTKYSRKNLKDRDIITGSLESKLQSFEDLIQFLINCSVKELRNETLTEDEYYQLLTYGGLLEYLTSSFAGDGMRWFEITSETDKNMAVIADIHTIAPNDFSNGSYFEVGVGPAYEIYVVVPIDGKLYLTRGAVFSYYEFEAEKRLTDEEWQKLLKENKQPPQLEWMKSFISDDNKDIPLPKEPYSSGC